MNASKADPADLTQRNRARKWPNLLPYVLLVPALTILFAVLVIPLFYNLGLSFMDFNLLRPAENGFVGLDNYRELLTNPTSRRSILTTLLFASVTVSIELLLGMGYALLLALPFPGVRFVRTLVLIPMMVSEVVAGLSWRLLFHTDFGLLNYLLSLIGVGRQVWLGSDLALASIMTVEVWQHTPFVTLILLAGLQTLPKEFAEAAEVDGATRWQRFRFVTLPLLKPIILLALVFRTMFTLRVFAPVWVLTGGGPADKTLVVGVDIYRTAFRYYEFGQAATLSIVLLIVTLAITLVYMRLLRREALS